MTNENNNGEASDVRAVSNEAARVETTEEGDAASIDRSGAAPTVVTIQEPVAVVDIIDVYALPDDYGTAGATVATTKEEAIVEGEIWCGARGNIK